MCIFSALVNSVNRTRIFARHTGDGRQHLVYSMAYAAPRDLAMILPLPTPPTAPEDAVTFIDLSNYPELFTDLQRCFPVTRGQAAQANVAPSAPMLTVYAVGSFEASFVPTQADFARLDPRFRLADELWRSLPIYDDFGFAIFKLKPGVKEIHPMAFTFPLRDPDRLFFPTVHVHHDIVESIADFDHVLYWQAERPLRLAAPFDFRHTEQAPRPVEQVVDLARTQGVVASGAALHRLLLIDAYPNADVWLHPQPAASGDRSSFSATVRR
jgi:hypothetical protein